MGGIREEGIVVMSRACGWSCVSERLSMGLLEDGRSDGWGRAVNRLACSVGKGFSGAGILMLRE